MPPSTTRSVLKGKIRYFSPSRSGNRNEYQPTHHTKHRKVASKATQQTIQQTHAHTHAYKRTYHYRSKNIAIMNLNKRVATTTTTTSAAAAPAAKGRSSRYNVKYFCIQKAQRRNCAVGAPLRLLHSTNVTAIYSVSAVALAH